ncbi:MAG: carboxypeptidase-like regulatory domain-containing protein, partial [Candidatus Acidiferrales bacterium]
MRTVRTRFLPGLLVLLLAGAVSAATQQRGGTVELRSIRGQVLDATTQRPLDRAFVSLRRESGSMVEQVTTSSTGGFEFVRVPADMYLVVAELAGYEGSSQRIDVTIGVASHVTVYLQPVAREAAAPPGGSVGVESLAIPDEARAQYERGWKAVFEEKNLEAG